MTTTNQLNMTFLAHLLDNVNHKTMTAMLNNFALNGRKVTKANIKHFLKNNKNV